MLEGVSRLRNRVLGRVFGELGLIEQWGSGIPRNEAKLRDLGRCSPLLAVKTVFRVGAEAILSVVYVVCLLLPRID